MTDATRLLRHLVEALKDGYPALVEGLQRQATVSEAIESEASLLEASKASKRDRG